MNHSLPLSDHPTILSTGNTSTSSVVQSLVGFCKATQSTGRVCPVCEGGNTGEFFEVKELPVHVCVLHEDRKSALEAPTGDVCLNFCKDCDFVFNSGFDPEIIDFRPGYDASLTFSPTFRSFSNQVADRLIGKYDLKNKDVVEIGCGEGYFLSLLAEKGANRCYGFDPTVKTPQSISVGDGSITTFRDYYRQSHREVPCDFLCCLSVMEDLQNPNQFVREMGKILGGRKVDCYFEIFNGMRAIEMSHTWSILYEQCNYFSAQSYAKLFQQNGFCINDFGTCYQDDEYLFVEATWTGRPEPANSNEFLSGGETQDGSISKFFGQHQIEIKKWTGILDSFYANSKTGVVWGTGGKGVSFLNSMKNHPALSGAVDINPRRHGKYVPGSGHLIMSPESLRQSPPAFIVITNPLYEKEIRQMVGELEVECEFFTT